MGDFGVSAVSVLQYIYDVKLTSKSTSSHRPQWNSAISIHVLIFSVVPIEKIFKKQCRLNDTKRPQQVCAATSSAATGAKGGLWAYYNCDSSTIQHPTRSYVLSSNNEHINSFALLWDVVANQRSRGGTSIYTMNRYVYCVYMCLARLFENDRCCEIHTQWTLKVGRPIYLYRRPTIYD